MKTIWTAGRSRLAAFAIGFTACQAACAAPVMLFDIAPDPAIVGHAVGVDVRLAGAADLYAFQFSIGFDPSVLRLGSIGEGGMLATGGSTFFYPGAVDDAAGTVQFILGSLLDAVPGVDGDGVLAHLDFDVMGDGTTLLRLSDVLLLDSSLAELSVETRDGILKAVPVPEPASLALVLLCLGVASAARRDVGRITTGARP
ncbi:MAG TPA: cohesin domain-containing protein [Roseateles sp.]